MIQSGMDAAVVEEMPVAKVILIDVARDFRAAADDSEKAYYVPLEHAQEFEEKLNEKLNGPKTRLGFVFANMLLPRYSRSPC